MVRRKAGYSLLEALAALTIMAGGLACLLELQQRLIAQQALREAQLGEAEAQINACALLADLNPLADPTGTLPLPPRGRLAWTSRPLTPARRNSAAARGDGDFEIRLFRIEVRMVDAAGRPLAPFTVDRVGWRRVAGPAR